jgi:hypothetical protein
MASALPEGQEALEVESACSEQAHPVSSNTTLQGLKHYNLGPVGTTQSGVCWGRLAEPIPKISEQMKDILWKQAQSSGVGGDKQIVRPFSTVRV